jgi:hypothetical protein
MVDKKIIKNQRINQRDSDLRNCKHIKLAFTDASYESLYQNRIFLESHRIFLVNFSRKILYDFLRETSSGAPGLTGSFAGARRNLPGSAVAHMVGGPWHVLN